MIQSRSCATGRSDILHAALLGLLTLLSRLWSSAPLYYVDGPRLLHCILDHTYVIQPPGYWLFAHLAGLFPDPVFGLHFLNLTFSTLGVAVFFLLCRRKGIHLGISYAATICYASVFYVWFAGSIHCSYSSQLLFPALTFYLFLCREQNHSLLLTTLCGISFAIGAGLRPTDGAFLGPLFLYLVWRYIPTWKERLFLLSIAAAACLAWYVPGTIAMRVSHQETLGQYYPTYYPMSVLLTGIQVQSIANMARFFMPLLAAYWLLFPLFFSQRDGKDNRILLLWVLPGMLFFLLIFIADPVYFCCISPAIVLAAALSHKRYTAHLLLACALFNIFFFLFAHPIRSSRPAVETLDFYLIKYSHYGLTHRWSDTPGHGGTIP